MKIIFETDSEFICDIQATCFRKLSTGEFLGLSAVFHENIFGYSASALTGWQAYFWN